jgi:hypothetical protein
MDGERERERRKIFGYIGRGKEGEREIMLERERGGGREIDER